MMGDSKEIDRELVEHNAIRPAKCNLKAGEV